jgi:hypothetical protein
MQKELIGRYYNKLFLGISCMLCLYLIARACCVDITDDEAWSFYNVKHFWYVEALCSGNTHWFNFLAIKASLLFGLEQTWQIRWFSVLSGIGFITVVYRWIKTLGNPGVKLFAFSVVLLHPYLLEYLSLARGYATGLCFMAISGLFLVKAHKSGKRPHNFYALLFAGLSALANFNFFYYFSAFCLLYFYRTYFKNGLISLKSKWFYIDAAYALLIITLVLRALLFIRECSNDIADFGGEELVPSVFKSYLRLLCYGNFSPGETALTISAFLLFGIVLLASGSGILKFKEHKSPVFLYASVLLLVMLALTVFNKWCFGTLYPTDRTALLFYPLIAIVIVEFVKCFLSRYSVVNIFMILLGLALFINFLFTINLKKGMDHAYCAGSKSCFNYLDEINAKKVGIPLDLYCVYSKYYQVTGTRFQAQSVNTFGHAVRWIPQNKLEDFNYVLLFPPYNLNYYKPSSVRFEGLNYFHESGALIVKVVKPG